MRTEINLDRATAAELALKAHILVKNPELGEETIEGAGLLQEITGSISLTEAPEDAVCTLVLDLMHYCEREQIDWAQEIISRASKRFGAEQAERISR